MYLFSLHLKRILIITFCAFWALGIYLFHLQISQTGRFAQLSQRNFLRKEKIASPRGNITDQYGTLLVTNRPLYSLYWQGTGSEGLNLTQRKKIAHVARVCSLFSATEQNSLSSLITQLEKAEHSSKRVLIKNDLSYEQVTQLIEQVPFEENLNITTTYERCYPHNELACHVVGYLGIKHDLSGKMGLEHIYNEKLQGQSGTLLKITNSLGKPVQAQTIKSASAGKTVRTTLDLSLQKIAEELFPHEYDGCFILMDEDGAIEVVVSRPSFEPSLFLKPFTHAQWDILQKNRGFINRAFSACYPPASLFKLVTLAAALETDLITPETQWKCTGSVLFKGRHYHCNRRWGHGTVATKKAFAMSCNIPFYEIGKSISIDTLADYAHQLGLGTKTGIDFPEKQGLIPTTHWKQQIKHEPWWPGETLSAVIGQSSLLVTPLQMARMVAAICTGYQTRPRILLDEPIVHEPVKIKASTLSFLQSCLTSVIKKGTGTSLKALSGFHIMGKSGTAQVRSRSNKPLEKKHLPHGYFAAHFQYNHEKPRTLVIFLENTGSSRHAIELARNFLTRYSSTIS